MRRRPRKSWLCLCAALLLGCGAGDDDDTAPDSGKPTDIGALPPADVPKSGCDIPGEAQAEDSSHPDHVVGDGTPAGCTGAAVVAAVAKGGVITFDCGPGQVGIKLTETIKVHNDTGPTVVIDGGGRVTLDGGTKVRILYQNTCDQDLTWTTDHCNDQPNPQLTVQNLVFVDGNAKGLDKDGGGGGAIFVRGGRLKVINSRFYNNVCDDTGTDVGGGAIRVLDQSEDKPVYVVGSTFGSAEGLGNVCANGGALSSIGVSYTVINSEFHHNLAIGRGANEPKNGAPGGGNGGAIYNDGNTYTLSLCGAEMDDNEANEGGGAIFFVSNDKSGSLVIEDSTLRHNASKQFETPGFPGIFVIAREDPKLTNSTLSKE